MDASKREALGSLRLTWAPTADDLWRSQGAVHVGGLNEHAAEDVLGAFADAQRDPESSPLGVVVRGPAGSGKTHLLGQVRERVQAAGGVFFVVELLDAASFWQSARSGILESLGRPGAERETQLKDVLWALSSIAHVSRSDRRAVIGDDDLTPETLERFVNALLKARGETVRRCHHTLRALVLLGAADLALQDIGEAYLQSSDEYGRDERDAWRIPAATASAQESVRDISRLIALGAPSVLAVDQIDTLLAQSGERTDAAFEPTDNRDLEHVAHGLMTIRETMRRTVPVVACLPVAWESIRERATATVQDRFRVTAPLQGLPTAAIGRAILERRFTPSYAVVGFVPPYPSWPILPSAFDDAPNYTPRQLLKRTDAHIRYCLGRGVVEELEHLSDHPEADAGPDTTTASAGASTALDRRFAEYRQRAVTAAAVDHEGEDTAMPGLLNAALRAWIAERGDESFSCDPPPGSHVVLHGRLRQSLDAATDDERHWAFRAIAASNAVAAQNRIKKAYSATGLGSNTSKRKLFLLRNTPWPTGPKTTTLIAAFHDAGGRTLVMSEDDVRTMSALRDLIDDDHGELVEWLKARRPAHGIALLREALGGEAGQPPPRPEPEPERGPEPEPSPDDESADSAVEDDVPPHSIPLGTDVGTGQTVSVELAALRKHIAIFAGSGSGKTVLIRRFVEECALRGVSSIVLDPNNDLSRLGTGWPESPDGWRPGDNAKATDYLANTEVVVWTPRRSAGRPLSFQPLPDFASVIDDDDEFSEAVDSAVAALEPRALISGQTAKATRARAVLREALQEYGRQPTTTLGGFVDMLADLPDISELSNAPKIAADLAQNLRAAMVNDPMFGGSGTPIDPGVLLTPSDGYRARVSVISMIGLPNEEQRQSFVNQLQMALFAWIKRNPAGDRPLGGLLVMDEAQTLAPSGRFTACTTSTLALSSQARKYGLGLVFATQAPKGLHNHIPGNAATQFYGLLNSPAQISTAEEMARVKGGRVPDISKLRAGNFYLAMEGEAFHRIVAPMCLSYHPQSPLTAEEVLRQSQQRPPP